MIIFLDLLFIKLEVEVLIVKILLHWMSYNNEMQSKTLREKKKSFWFPDYQ